MKSKIMSDTQKELINHCRQMTPEQRLEAFVTHSRLMTEIYLSGQKHRNKTKQETKKP